MRDFCAEYDLLHCVDPFETTSVHGDITYWRLHGRGRLQGVNWPPSAAQKVSSEIQEGLEDTIWVSGTYGIAHIPGPVRKITAQLFG